MQLSALDQSPIFSGRSPAEALEDTLRCARACDQLGLSRYWVAEHHGAASFAGCAPEVFIPLLAARTERIRIGSGGVMLNHYSPYKVAECFAVLESLFPGRVDLGIGRAPGSDSMQAGALAYGSRTTGVDLYPTKVSDLIAWGHNRRPAAEAFRRVRLTPGHGSFPPIWQLASSPEGAMYAAHFDLPLALAAFIAPDCLRAGPLYREALREKAEKSGADSGFGGRVMLAVFALCADTEAEARQLAAPAALWRRRVASGRFSNFQRTERALAELEASGGADRSETRALVGTPAQIGERLQDMVERSGADELMVVTICEEVDKRIRSYELLQEVVSAL